VKEIIKSKYSAFFFVALAFHVLCAWFSRGFYQVDEHFQILEFANYKLGYNWAGNLPWEFASQVRASLLPDLVYVVHKLLAHIGIHNPFVVIFSLRLFTGIAAWYVSCRLCLLLIDDMKTEIGKRMLILLSLFMWFVPALNVRFSSENVSGISFLYGLYFILKSLKENKNQFAEYAIAGGFFGIAFFIRIQLAVAIAGFIAWLVFIKKGQWKNIAILIASAGLLLVVNYLLDWWYYGKPSLTPLNYFYSNIVLHKAADYGVSPWSFYFREFYFKAIPPLSLIILIMFGVGVLRNLKNPLVWAFVPFFVMLCCIGHKELRFLFSVTFIGLYITALGLDYLLSFNIYRKIHWYVWAISLIIILPLFTYSVFGPEDVSAEYSYYLYNHISKGENTVFALSGERDWGLSGTTSTFYRSPLMKDAFIKSPNEIITYMDSTQIDSAFFLDKKSKIDFKLNGYKTEKVYCFYPMWVINTDINNWRERTNIWTIYQVSKTRIKP
jgi:phosphatidylinositol glycan class B